MFEANLQHQQQLHCHHHNNRQHHHHQHQQFPSLPLPPPPSSSSSDADVQGQHINGAKWKTVKRELPEDGGRCLEMETCSSEDSRDNAEKKLKASDYELASSQEEEKKKMRRERNKVAAAKCRQRRVDLTNALLCETEKLEDEKSKLEEEIRTLELQRAELQLILDSHSADCANVVVVVKEEKGSFYPGYGFRGDGSTAAYGGAEGTLQTGAPGCLYPQQRQQRQTAGAGQFQRNGKSGLQGDHKTAFPDSQFESVRPSVPPSSSSASSSSSSSTPSTSASYDGLNSGLPFVDLINPGNGYPHHHHHHHQLQQHQQQQQHLRQHHQLHHHHQQQHQHRQFQQQQHQQQQQQQQQQLQHQQQQHQHHQLQHQQQQNGRDQQLGYMGHHYKQPCAVAAGRSQRGLASDSSGLKTIAQTAKQDCYKSNHNNNNNNRNNNVITSASVMYYNSNNNNNNNNNKNVVVYNDGRFQEGQSSFPPYSRGRAGTDRPYSLPRAENGQGQGQDHHMGAVEATAFRL